MSFVGLMFYSKDSGWCGRNPSRAATPSDVSAIVAQRTAPFTRRHPRPSGWGENVIVRKAGREMSIATAKGAKTLVEVAGEPRNTTPKAAKETGSDASAAKQ